MRRRDFLKNGLVGAGSLLSLGLWPGSARGSAQQARWWRPCNRLRIIDAYGHFSSMEVIQYLEDHSGIPGFHHPYRGMFASAAGLIDAEARLNVMDESGVDLSILIPLPWIEDVPAVYNDPQLCAGAAVLLNDQLAEITAQYPDRFRAAALLPTTNADVMLLELERAVNELNMIGGMFVVGPTVKPPDHDDYWELYAKAAELDVPLWIHPSRPNSYPDYVGESGSTYMIAGALGWEMDSATAMIRITMGGVFDAYPDLKLIIHHCGSYIPLYHRRIQMGWDMFEEMAGMSQPTTISKPYMEHFKNFYCDTATQAYNPLRLQMAYDFFGPDHLLFGTDDMGIGSDMIIDTRKSVEGLDRDIDWLGFDLEKIYYRNAERLILNGNV